jgi:hypothetical protein
MAGKHGIQFSIGAGAAAKLKGRREATSVSSMGLALVGTGVLTSVGVVGSRPKGTGTIQNLGGVRQLIQEFPFGVHHN